MNKIDLTQYCNPEDYRQYCRDPFQVGNHVYATDGCILIKVPVDVCGSEIVSMRHPDPELILSPIKDQADQLQWQPMPVIDDCENCGNHWRTI